MFKVLRPVKDAYITNRITNGVAQLQANVGLAGSMDLFKLYGYTSTVSGSTITPNTELSRLLIHFDLQPLRDLIAAGQVDFSNSSFSCRLHLFDVYGGQPCPDHYSVTVNPLSASFDEGHGKDVVFYSDFDVCNWLTSSLASGSWLASGCAQGSTSPSPGDYFTDYSAQQTFGDGTEDLDIDITTIVSATLAGLLPDAGLRIAFSAALEGDTHSYFVKRFASRGAFNAEKRPVLYIRYDDSIQDDTNNLFLDSTSYLFLYNYVRGAAANLTSGSTAITGSNSLILQMQTPVSGGLYSLFFTGSQYFSGRNPQVGIYSASVTIPMNDPLLLPQWQASGSITFTPTWKSLDGTVLYAVDPPVKALLPQRGPQSLVTTHLDVSVMGLHEEYGDNDQQVLRVNLWDFTQPFLTNAVRLPVELPGIIVRDAHYQVRDNDNGFVAIPFDQVHNSTRLSNDTKNMFFTLDTSSLIAGHSYVIDILVATDNAKQLYRGASKVFRVVPGE
jgi:hypothetical protein